MRMALATNKPVWPREELGVHLLELLLVLLVHLQLVLVLQLERLLGQRGS
jgi:hypothetical protein